MARSNIKFPSDYVVRYVNRPMLSGLFEGRTDYDTMQANEVFRDVVLVEKKETGWERTGWKEEKKLLGSLGYWPEGFYPVSGDDCQPVHSGCRVESPCMNIGKSLWNPPILQYSGMFTGEMQFNSQMLFGMGRKFPYRYCWDRTHGVFKCQNGDRWIIEVSIEDGVTAWKMAKADRSGPGPSYRPIAVTSLPPLADRKLLLSPAAMATYGTTFGFYLECGWAFSADGHKAVNVTYDIYSVFPVESLRTYLWDLDIIESENEPVSASLVLDGPHWFWGQDESSANIKFPYIWGQSGACHRTPHYSRDPGFGWQPPPSYDRAPIFACYMGDQRVVLHFRVDEGFNTPVDENPENAAFTCGMDSFGIDGVPYGGGSGSYRVGTDVKSRVTWFEVEGLAKAVSDPEPFWTSRASDYTYSMSQQGGFVSRGGQIYSEHWEIDEELVIHEYNGGAIFEHVIIPYWKRDAFYLLQVQANSQGGLPVHRTTTRSVISGTATGSWETIYSFAWRGPHGSNPCPCEYFGQGVWNYGIWIDVNGPTGTLDDGYLSGGTMIPVLGQTHDPSVDRPLHCFDSSRAVENVEPSGCKGEVAHSTGGCEARTSIVNQDVEPPSDGYVLMHYYDESGTTEIINDVYDVFQYQDYWKYVGNPGEDGCFTLIASIDAVSKTGWISTNIYNPHVDKLVLGGIDSYYPEIYELNLVQCGWFGIPLPEIS